MKIIISKLKREHAEGVNKIEFMETEAEGVTDSFKDLAEDSVEEKLDLKNAIATIETAAEIFRIRFEVYDADLAALDEKNYKANVTVKEENATDEAAVMLDLLEQYLKEHQKRRGRI